MEAKTRNPVARCGWPDVDGSRYCLCRFEGDALDGWDEGSNPEQCAHSLNDVTFDGDWVSFLHELDFDKDPYTTTNPAYPYPACPLSPTLTTEWRGVMEFGLYNVDNAPDGAPGWQESREWQLVACDRNDDGKFLKIPLSVQGHHALTDGIHVGRFYAEVQGYLQQPGVVLGEV